VVVVPKEIVPIKHGFLDSSTLSLTSDAKDFIMTAVSVQRDFKIKKVFENGNREQYV
jgi:hypothetical protein